MGKISQLPILDRPREKALKNGVESLSDYELLALILQSGCKNKSVLEVSMELIIKFNGLYNLFNSSIYELSKCEGIGKVKSLNIIVINELFKRFSQKMMVVNDNIKLSSGLDVYNYSKLKYYDITQEKVVVYYLNIKNIIIFEQVLSIGNDSMSIFNNKLICKTSIEKYAKKVIIIHNHPSGNSSPSIDDISSFYSLKNALKVINVKLVDHVIIGSNEFYSIIDESKYKVD